MKSFAVFALVSNISAIKLRNPVTEDIITSDSAVGPVVTPQIYHWNEDPHSVPDILSRRGGGFTSTIARYFKDGKLDTDTEVKEINPRHHRAYNELSTEPKTPTWYDFVQIDKSGILDDMASDTESVDSEAGDLVQTLATTTIGSTVLWHVPVDYGELDDHVVDREADSGNGTKNGGWTNPLAWTDNGSGDEQFLNVRNEIEMVKSQFASLLQYDESEGPTKADNGENDELVVGRVKGFNPLSWSDDGADDDTVLTQLRSKYDESEGPTKADNGENDELVVGRVRGFNPLSWSDNGADDDSVLTQLSSKYDESEGPTKADNGENDELVVGRVRGFNPLSWADNGEADETVV